MRFSELQKADIPPEPVSPACRRFRLQCQESLEQANSCFSEVRSLSPHARSCSSCMLFAEQLFVLHQETAAGQTSDVPQCPADLADTIMDRLNQEQGTPPIFGILTAILSCFGIIFGSILGIHWLLPSLGSSRWMDRAAEMNSAVSGWLSPVSDALVDYVQMPEALGKQLILWTDHRYGQIFFVLSILTAGLLVTQALRRRGRNSRSTGHQNGALQ